MSTNVTLPGRLGNPAMTLADDPRADPRMLMAMAPFGMAAAPGPSTVHADSPIDDVRDFCAQNETGCATVATMLTDGLPAIDGVHRWTHTILGADGNEITLFIHRPIHQDRPLPGIIH